jgi:membrane fusion protein, heavy metal efflux system
MSDHSLISMSRGMAVISAAVLVATSAAATYVLVRRAPSGGTPTGIPAAASVPSASAEAAVSLTPEAIERAGIVVAPVTRGTSSASLRLPGIVQANAYRQLAITPLVRGRVTRVAAELGARVRRGQRLAEIYSPELAEAQTRFVTAAAMLDAHDRELQRTQKLVEIGAASRQELERIHAEHAAQGAAVKSTRSQLELLGLSASTIETLSSGNVSAAVDVTSPIDGIVTERTANAGLNVDSSTRLFTVVDLSTVWAVADVYERDFATVRVGTEATVTAPAYPELSLTGRVSYIDPQVSAETRTAKVRVEVPNSRGDLRLGMYADVSIVAAAGATALLVPRSAIQQVGERTVVYVADPAKANTFVEREVRVQPASADLMEVASGLQEGDRVVTKGSFFVRAERERLGLKPS